MKAVATNKDDVMRSFIVSVLVSNFGKPLVGDKINTIADELVNAVNESIENYQIDRYAEQLEDLYQDIPI